MLLISTLSGQQTKTFNGPEEQADYLTDMAYSMVRKDPAKSLEYSEIALQISIASNYTDGQINAFLLTGMVYKQIGAYDKSAEAYFQALKIAESDNNTIKISSCFNNIGNIYQTQGNFEKALEYYLLSLQIEEERDNKEQISIRLYNIGVLYESVDSLNRALTYYYNSLLIEEEIGNKEGIFYALYGIAGIEIQLQRYENALSNLNRASSTARSMNDEHLLALCFQEKGNLYLSMKRYDQAELALDSALFFAINLQMKKETMEIYRDLSLVMSAIGNSTKAYSYLNMYVLLRDTISNIEISAKVAELETRFQVEKTQEELEYLKTMNKIKTEKAESEKRNRNFLLITIVMIIILWVFNLQRIAPDTRSVIIISILVLLLIPLTAFLLAIVQHRLQAEAYLTILKDVLTFSVPVLFIMLFIAERILLKKYVEKARAYTQELQDLLPAPRKQIIKLQFEGKDAEIEIPLMDLLCFAANDNYISVYYLLNQELKTEMYRSTMKMIEDKLSEYDDIVRCHKSHIINTMNVDHVSGNAQGYKIHIRHLDFAIPVSRKFPASLIQKLKERK